MALPSFPVWLRTAARRTLQVTVWSGVVYLLTGYLAMQIRPAPTVLAATASVTPEAHHVLVSGVLSVHSERSHDAVGSIEDVAAAARRTGLDFVVLGDHPGDWMEAGLEAMAPRRERGVLLVPGLELPVAGIGRTLVVGLDTLPKRWEGDVASLSARVDSLAGFVSVVHPRSPRSREAWTGLDAPGVHAWESFDVSEMARLRLEDRWAPYHIASLLGGLFTGQGHGALAGLWRKSSATRALASYDSVRVSRPVVLTGGLNHHPKVRFGSLLFPAYRPFFRTVVNHVVLPEELPDDPQEGRARILEALKKGNLFVTLGPGGEARAFCLHGLTPGEAPAEMGDHLPYRDGSVIRMRLPGKMRGRPLVRILRDGTEVAWLSARKGQIVEWPVPEAGVYRVEVYTFWARLGPWVLHLRPWIFANPVGVEDSGDPPPGRPGAVGLPGGAVPGRGPGGLERGQAPGESPTPAGP